MKKTLKILAVVLSVCIIMCVLASCSKTLSGTFANDTDVILLKNKDTYTFSGRNFTHSTVTTGGISGSQTTTEVKGTYEIKELEDGTSKIFFTITNEDGSKTTNSFSFSEGKDDNGAVTITISGVTYTKVAKN